MIKYGLVIMHLYIAHFAKSKWMHAINLGTATLPENYIHLRYGYYCTLQIICTVFHQLM